MYICPKCGSLKTFKEKIMGSDTMDRVCSDCNYTASKQEFKEKEKKSKHNG